MVTDCFSDLPLVLPRGTDRPVPASEGAKDGARLRRDRQSAADNSFLRRLKKGRGNRSLCHIGSPNVASFLRLVSADMLAEVCKRQNRCEARRLPGRPKDGSQVRRP